MKKGSVTLKEVLVVCVTSLILVSGLIALLETRSFKNFYGARIGYGTCPNDGDSWWWKESGSILIGDLKEGKDYKVQSGKSGMQIQTTGVRYGVMICEECLDHPDRLDPAKIEKNLIESDWEPKKAAAARKAVEAYKEQNKIK